MTTELEDRVSRLEHSPARYSGDLKPRHELYGSLSLKAVVIFCVVLSVAGAIIVNMQRQPPSPIPRQIIASAGTPLYYPADLPPGFAIDTSSIEYTQRVLTYTVTYDGGKKLAFSVQPKPSDFDFSSFYAEGRRIESSLGPAYVGAVGGNTVVSITSDKTWILIGVPDQIETPQLEAVVANFTQARN